MREVAEAALAGPDPQARIRTLFEEQYDFVWRSLRRLGLQTDVVDDAAQEVFMVAARRIEEIAAGSERSFLYGTALRVASTLRRTKARRREADAEEGAIERVPDPAPALEDLADRKRAREMLDHVLEAMPIELRAVFTLYEIEDLTMIEISRFLDLPQGTVASRLRRARELFEHEVKKLRPIEDRRRV
jgi:RNA polymerase sigma-70 factor, ECF subfamily